MMKKLFLSIVFAASCGMFAGCGTVGSTTGDAAGNGTVAENPQDNGNSFLGALAGSMAQGQDNGAGSIIGNIISTFGSGIMTNQSSLVGTWAYQKPCVQFESENLLAKAGGALVASKMEEKLAEYYQKVGIKPGVCKFVFAKDNTVSYTIGERTYHGTYKFDSSKRQVTITTTLGSNITAYVSITGNNMGLTFDATKLLTLLKSSSVLSSQLGSLSSLAKSVTGMKAGFEFAR